MKSAKFKVNRRKALIMVFAVVNAQKQGVMGARLALTTRTTMFQECAKLAFSAQEGGTVGDGEV